MSTPPATIPTRLLVLGMSHEDGTVLLDELLPVAEACGQSAEQVRSCLRRLVSEGLFVRHGTGKGTRFEATPAGLDAIGSGIERTRLAYAQDAAGRGWDRKWRLVAFAVGERDRAARDGLRDRLLRLGGAAVQGGLYVSPHPWHADVMAEAGRLGIADAVTIATTDDLEIGGERDPRRLAASLWPLDDLRRRYEAFIDRFTAVPEVLGDMRERHERLTDASFLPGAFAMAVAFQEVFGDDPLLPPELLPRPWPGRAARELVIRSRRLALTLRRGGSAGPALFRSTFDDAVEMIP